MMAPARRTDRPILVVALAVVRDFAGHLPSMERPTTS